jgi:hypothetical protein
MAKDEELTDADWRTLCDTLRGSSDHLGQAARTGGGCRLSRRAEEC